MSTLSEAVNFENHELARAAHYRKVGHASPLPARTTSTEVPATPRTTGLVLPYDAPAEIVVEPGTMFIRGRKIIAQCSCDKLYTLAEFLELQPVGFIGGGEIPERYELRNCTCGSTISRPVP